MPLNGMLSTINGRPYYSYICLNVQTGGSMREHLSLWAGFVKGEESGDTILRSE